MSAIRSGVARIVACGGNSGGSSRMGKKVLMVSLTSLQAKHWNEAVEVTKAAQPGVDLSEQDILKQLAFAWIHQVKQGQLQTQLQSEFWKTEQESLIPKGSMSVAEKPRTE